MGEIVSASIGVMNPLLLKLGTLMGDEYKKLKGVKKQTSFLIRELSAMKAALEKLELMDKLDSQAKDWRGHVREMSFDMEDCIDDFTCDLGDANAKQSFIKKNIRRFKYLGARHQIAQHMEDLKALALEANERRMRYRIDDRTNPSSGIVLVDPRISAIYKEAAGLVGIDGPKKELVNWLTNNEKKLKVVSIVGFGGLGKTTLAKQVYDKMRGKFTCQAFVSVSQRPDMISLLSGLQLKLGVGKEESSRACETQDIIDNIRKHLTRRRYLIIVDDLWDQSAWNIISCAFTENGNGSRVIVTTRVDDVAAWACSNDRECIYRMKPLKEEDSRVLFFNRIFASGDGCPPNLREVSAQILRKCGGLPLAIITIASLLANCQVRSRDEWESIRNSLGAQLSVKPTLEEMRSILNLSYIHLPLHLRPCFMYLGMYPEDREIQRDDLVRLWIAENFVSNLHGQDMEFAAKSYFNELINRSLILPERNEHGELMSCRVHDMMLDLILSKCAEDNFITVECSHKEMAREHGWKYKVRRISLNLSGGVAEDGAASGTIGSRLKKIRSIAWFGESKYILPLLHFKYLRVILFEIRGGGWQEEIDLRAINQLFQLEYLKVSVNQVVRLPNEMQGLVHLETLELGCTWTELPLDIVHLPRLSHLIVLNGRELPHGTRNMKSLRTLDRFDVGRSSMDNIRGLAALTNLRSLWLRLSSRETRDKLAALVSSIGMLHNLRYLHIDGHCKYENGLLDWLSDPPHYIMVLELTGVTFPRVPNWFGSLQCLRHLELCVRETSTEEVHFLGELPPLVYLSLEVMSFDTAVIFSTGIFPVLEDFKCMSRDDDVTAYLVFEVGAMPKLRRLELEFDGDRWGGATPVGLEHLLSLKHIDAYISSSDSEGFPIQVSRDAESAFGKATREHPNRPSFTIDEHDCALFD
uniref:Uncharacterized protein n=1 Tax=Avena sativa TaxID=4498 RepID=A0ACD5V765_AVESA